MKTECRKCMYYDFNRVYKCELDGNGIKKCEYYYVSKI